MASLDPLQGTLGTRRAAHLLRRTSFRFTKARVDLLAGMTASNAVSTLLNASPLTLQQPTYSDGTNPSVTWINPVGTADPTDVQDFTLRRWVLTWWCHEALSDPGISHKMIFFLHQHSPVTATTSSNEHFFDYLMLLRWGALGNWKKFCTKMVMDNIMLRYLNNTNNTANNPNENFAREFLELFTIGKGPQVGDGDYTNYTEEDVAAAAQVFTGVRVLANRTQSDPETGIPRGTLNAAQHNWQQKTFSNRLGNLVIPAVTVASQKTATNMANEINTFINRVFDQPETSRAFCRRLYRFFIGEKINAEIETDIIVPLATEFKNGNFEIEPILQKLLTSKHFFAEDNASTVKSTLGGVIKPPIDNAFQALSFFNVPIPDLSTPANDVRRFRFYSQAVIDRMLLLAGLPLFQPSDVAGYPAYHQEPDYSHQWFNGSTVIARYKLPDMLLSGKMKIGGNPNGTLYTQLNIVDWVKNSGFFSDPADSELLVQELLLYLFPHEVDTERFKYFHEDIFLNNLPPYDWTEEWNNYLATNNASEVKIALERLINSLMYSQEFQTT